MKSRTYFISHTTRTSYDVKCATWTDWIFRNKLGAETIIQEYDFQPGDNFKEKMHDALLRSDVVICILTHAYQESAYCTDEWTNAERIIPIRFDDCTPHGLLKSIVYIDLYGLCTESARERLIEKMTGMPRPIIEPSDIFMKVEPPFPDLLAAVNHNATHTYYIEPTEESSHIVNESITATITEKVKEVLAPKAKTKYLYTGHKMLLRKVLGFLAVVVLIIMFFLMTMLMFVLFGAMNKSVIVIVLDAVVG